MNEGLVSAMKEVAEVAKSHVDIMPDFFKDLKSSENVDINKPVDSKEDIQVKNIENISNPPIENKSDGIRRENDVRSELEKQYPEKDGYSIESEVYLRDKDGNIVRDQKTGEARRIDFVVVKDGKVVDSIEVTSKTASKTEQSAKEERIREQGGNYIKDKSGNLVEIPQNIKTRIERRD